MKRGNCPNQGYVEGVCVRARTNLSHDPFIKIMGEQYLSADGNAFVCWRASLINLNACTTYEGLSNTTQERTKTRHMC